MYLVSIYVTVVFVVHIKGTASMLLPLLPPEISKPTFEGTTVTPSNNDNFIFKMARKPYQAVAVSGKNFQKSGVRFNDNYPPITEKSIFTNKEGKIPNIGNDRKTIEQSRYAYQREQLPHNFHIKRKLEVNEQRNMSAKSDLSTDKMNVMGISQNSQIPIGTPGSENMNQIDEGTLLQTLFTSIIRNNRKKGVKKVLSRFIENLQKIVDSAPATQDSMKPVEQHDNRELSNTFQTTYSSYEKMGDVIQNQKSFIEKKINERSTQADNSHHVALTTSKQKPVSRKTFKTNASILEEENKTIKKANIKEQRVSYQKLDKISNLDGNKAPEPIVYMKKEVNSPTHKVETNSVNMGLTSNFDKLYKRLFLEDFRHKDSKKNNIPLSGSQTRNSHRKMPKHSKKERVHTKNISDGHKTREMFRNLAEYAHSWNRQSSKESYDQFIHVEVINSPHFN